MNADIQLVVYAWQHPPDLSTYAGRTLAMDAAHARSRLTWWIVRYNPHKDQDWKGYSL